MQNSIRISLFFASFCVWSIFLLWNNFHKEFTILTIFFKTETKLEDLDQGLLFQFVNVKLAKGSNVTGEVIGVYNERPFMWNSKNRDTLAMFKCTNPKLDLHSLSTNPESKQIQELPTYFLKVSFQMKMPFGRQIRMKSFQFQS